MIIDHDQQIKVEIVVFKDHLQLSLNYKKGA